MIHLMAISITPSSGSSGGGTQLLLGIVIGMVIMSWLKR